MSVKINFNNTLNVITILSIALIAMFFGYKWMFPQKQLNSFEIYYAEGQYLAELPNLNESNYEKSLVLILNTTCKYCNESTEFYRKLINSGYNSKTRQIVTVFPQSSEIVNKYIQENSLTVRSIPSSSFETLKSPITPTIVLVDNQRK